MSRLKKELKKSLDLFCDLAAEYLHWFMLMLVGLICADIFVILVIYSYKFVRWWFA